MQVKHRGPVSDCDGVPHNVLSLSLSLSLSVIARYEFATNSFSALP